MAVINKEVFVDAWLKPGSAGNTFRAGAARYVGREHYNKAAEVAVRIDRESALEMLDMMRDFIAVRGGQMNKGFRPWDVAPGSIATLNRAEPWWGWEFETGYRTEEGRSAATTHAWDNYDGVVFDSEGEGNYHVEITFSPAEMSKYLDGSADAYKFMQWLSDNRELTMRTNGNNVGTHLNMSSPKFAENTNNVAYAQRFMNNSIDFLQETNGQRKRMFGRESLYAGFLNMGRWLEGKCFRTTYDMEEFEDFIKTGEALQKAMDLILDTPLDTRAALARSAGVSNLYDVAFNGAEPIIRELRTLEIAEGAARLYTRSDTRAQANSEYYNW